MGSAPARPLTLALLPLLGLACSPANEPALSPLAREGRQIYVDVCVACHNGDPNLDGAIGPANAGASEALLEAKLVRGEYPPGYTPKRPESAAMPKFPYLQPRIPALAAYLREVQEDTP